MGCSCKTTFRRHYVFDIKVIEKDQKTDGIYFQSESGDRGVGSYSAWVGFLGYVPKKGEVLAKEDGACIWESRKFWNPVWSDSGFYRLKNKGKKILKKERR